MAEGALFLLIGGLIITVIVYFSGFTNVDPRLIMGALFLLLLPGFYAAVTSGPFVPSSRKRHKDMLKLADLNKKDIVYDLGCGDGRLVFSAGKKAKKAIGYELSIPLYLFGRLRQLFSFKPVSIRYGNIWNQDYSDATVIFCYLLPKSMKKFHEKIWPKLKPGTRVISNAFEMHDLKPIKQEDKVYLYQIPQKKR